jgi:hypothetical protein
MTRSGSPGRWPLPSIQDGERRRLGYIFSSLFPAELAFVVKARRAREARPRAIVQHCKVPAQSRQLQA